MELLVAVLDRKRGSPTVLGFGGSRGAAKSGGVRRIALTLAQGFPGTIVWIIRRVWDDLNKDHVKPLFVEHPELQPFWHAGDKELKLENGSSIFFIHAGDSGRAKRKARGPQAHYIFLEQAEEFSQEEMEQLAGSNRAPGVRPGFCKRIYTFNPGGIGTNYLRRIFHLREFRENESASDFKFIQGYGWDNYEWFRGLNLCTESQFYEEWTEKQRFECFIEQTDFGRKLNALPPAQRIGELMGSFENFAGQYYSDVWEQKTCVLPLDIVSRIIKPWWPRWIATDWGFSHYAATGWGASGILSPEEIEAYFGVRSLTPVRVLIVYRELVTNKVAEPDLARMIVHMTPEAERREIRFNFIGPDAWAKRGDANTVVEQMDPVFARGGLPSLYRADNDRVGGWCLLYNCWASARRMRTAQGEFAEKTEDLPALFISSACPEIISAVPMLVSDYDPITNPNGNPKDVRKMAGQIHDDVADMLRYNIKSYLKEAPEVPRDVMRAETYQRYQDPTARAMAMLRLTAAEEQVQYISRRRRA